MNKEIISKIKQEIKEKEAHVRFLKNQRKTVRIVGERKMSHWDAEEELRCINLCPYYIVYYMLKHRIELPKFVKSETRKDWRGNPIEVLDNIETFRNAIVGCCGEKCWILSEEYNSNWWHQIEDTARAVINQINEWEVKYGKED